MRPQDKEGPLIIPGSNSPACQTSLLKETPATRNLGIGMTISTLSGSNSVEPADHFDRDTLHRQLKTAF